MQHYDIIAIGAGPAGLAAAVQLARQGWAVAVIRDDGESRQVWPETLADPRVVAGAFPAFEPSEIWGVYPLCNGVNYWGGDRQESGHRWGVDRQFFDDRLRRDAEDSGCHFFVAPASEIGLDDSDDAWTVRCGERRLAASYVLDAAGRHSPFGRRYPLFAWRTIAIIGEWIAAADAPAFWLEPFHEGWAWGMKSRFGGWWLALFMDAARLRGSNVRKVYMDVCCTLRLRPPGRGWREPVKLFTRLVTPSAVADPVGKHVCHVGDAALSRDPMCSQGVTAGIAHGLRVAAAIHTWLRHPEIKDRVWQFLLEDHQRAVRRHRESLRAAFDLAAGSGAFWQVRRPSTAREDRSTSPLHNWPQSMRWSLGAEWRLEIGPVLTGNFVSQRFRLVRQDEEDAVAFLGDRSIAELLAASPEGHTTEEWRARLRSSGGEAWASSAFQWLTQRHILVPDATSSFHRATPAPAPNSTQTSSAYRP